MFVMPVLPTGHDVAVLGFREFAKHEIAVEVLVVPALPGSPSSGPSWVEGFPITYAADAEELDRAIGERTSTSVFFDYVFGLTPPTLRGAPLYSALRARTAIYCIISAGALPPVPPPSGLVDRVRRIASRAGNATHPGRLAEYVGRKFAHAFSPQTLSQPAPFRIYTGHSQSLRDYLDRTAQSDASVRWINSFDYDTYLNYLASHGGVVPASEQTAVFLDEAASSHRDFELTGATGMRLPGGEYSASMRRLFDAVERYTGLRVVIAAHPRSDYDSLPGFFGNREIILGQTVDLVARSALVIAHASTSIAYAVLFDKPLLLARTKEMSGTMYEIGLAMFAEGLSISPVFVGAAVELECLNWDYSGWARGAYEDYCGKYICASETPPDKTTWEIVIEDLVASGALAVKKVGHGSHR